MLCIVCALLSFAVKAYGISTTWIWSVDGRSATLDEIYLEGFEKYSFIRLDFAAEVLTIDEVQKSNRLEPQVRFCSTALPAAISNFFDLHSLSIQDVKVIVVLNAAEPSEAGCRCYVRPMIAMGFTKINGKVLKDEDVPAFCKSSGFGYIVARIPEGSSARVLPASPIGQEWISSSQSFNTYN